QLQSKTTIRASPTFKKTRLWLNGVEQETTNNKRLQNCLRETRNLRKEHEEKCKKEEGKDVNVVPLSEYNLHICSENNFPTAAGLASSASGFACLIARQGSGSACRSLFGGFVAWEMGSRDDGSDSCAKQIASEMDWPELEILVCVVSDAKKGTSSTEGMQTTVNTSTLLQHRINQVVPERMNSMIKAISNKDFNKFAELTMKDSNQFHAVCLDTFPPIFYLNDISRAIIQLITEYNNSSGSGDGDVNYKAAYTFDAGPNAVIYTLKKHVPELINLISKYFPSISVSSSNEDKEDFFNDPFNLFPDRSTIGKQSLPLNFNEKVIPIFPKGSIKQIIHTKIGDGPRIIFNDNESLLNSEGFPKRFNN
ncbi:2355_t:CDS:2, partial [Entrophospora sp. SA101]